MPPDVNVTSRYLPKREELSLMPVLAFPKASMIGFIMRIFSSRSRFGAFGYNKTLFTIYRFVKLSSISACNQRTLPRVTSCLSSRLAVTVLPVVRTDRVREKRHMHRREKVIFTCYTHWQFDKGFYCTDLLRFRR